jgi:PAS domain S-box-containing protein
MKNKSADSPPASPAASSSLPPGDAQPPPGRLFTTSNGQALYQALLAAIPDAVFVADVGTGLLLDVNQAGCRLLGLPAEKIIGQHHTMLHPPLERERYAALFQASFRISGQSGRADIKRIELVRADGTTIPCDISSLAMEENGRHIMFGIFRDIRGLLRSEEQRRLSEKCYALALRSITEGIWDWEPATNVVSFSDRCLEILGYAPDEVPHTVDTWRAHLHPEDADWVRSTLRQCADGLLPTFSIEYRMRHKDGRYRWIRSQGTMLRDGSGTIVRLAGGNSDITAHREAEQALRESEQRFRLQVENSPDAFFLHDMEGAILDVNHRACCMLGYEAAELLAMHIYDIEVICPPETLLGFWRDVCPGPFSFDGLGRRKDGTTFPTEVQGVVFTERGRLLGLVATRDVTLRKKLERKLKQARDQAMAANQAKSEFLARMSHEIRTPLNILLGMTELLRETLLTDRQRQYADTIESSGNMLLRLIDDILDLSRIEANRITLYPKPFSHGNGCAPRRIHAHPDRTKRPDLDPGPGRQPAGTLADRSGPSPADSAQSAVERHQVYAPGRHRTGGRYGGHGVGAAGLHIFVSDTGIGIAADQFERIFDPFTQIDASTRRRHGGTGLGLAICKRLVGLLGGRIHSTVPWARRALHDHPAPQTSPPGQARTRPKRFDRRHREPRPGLPVAPRGGLSLEPRTVKLFLEGEPCSLAEAETGTEALSLFAGQTFDLVLMDMEMPGMDGCETTSALRRLERETGLRPTPIIMLTAHAFSEYEEKCRQAGCNGFLSKPIRKAQLIMELHRQILEAARQASDTARDTP